jgi:hypothetical protein
LANCTNLASIIVDSAREDISLERLIAEVHEEVMREAALSGGTVNEIELTRRIHEIMQDGGMYKNIRAIKEENLFFYFYL